MYNFSVYMCLEGTVKKILIKTVKKNYVTFLLQLRV